MSDELSWDDAAALVPMPVTGGLRRMTLKRAASDSESDIYLDDTTLLAAMATPPSDVFVVESEDDDDTPIIQLLRAAALHRDRRRRHRVSPDPVDASSDDDSSDCQSVVSESDDEAIPLHMLTREGLFRVLVEMVAARCCGEHTGPFPDRVRGLVDHVTTVGESRVNGRWNDKTFYARLRTLPFVAFSSGRTDDDDSQLVRCSLCHYHRELDSLRVVRFFGAPGYEPTALLREDSFLRALVPQSRWMDVSDSEECAEFIVGNGCGRTTLVCHEAIHWFLGMCLAIFCETQQHHGPTRACIARLLDGPFIADELRIYEQLCSNLEAFKPQNDTAGLLKWVPSRGSGLCH